MESSQDTEITLGTGKLLGLFFGLVIICAVFFAFGYTLGRKSDAGITTASATPPTPTASGAKPASTSTQPTPPMTFYKAVEQKDANPQLTPAADPSSPATGTPAASSDSASLGSSGSAPSQPQAANSSEPVGTVPTAGYFVQVAAVSKEDDANALVDALKKKQYPAFVAASSSSDKLFHVQVGPFADVKDAEAMRARLINDGYSPILKK